MTGPRPGKPLPPYVSRFRAGRLVRYRFRRKGFKSYYFRGEFGSAEFWEEYRACMAGEMAPRLVPGAARTKPGTIDHLCVLYYQSPEFHSLAATTQRKYRGKLDKFRSEHGNKRVRLVERHHIKKIIADLHETPAAANNFLDRLKVLFAFALDIGMRPDNPTLGLRGIKIRSQGFATWSEEDIAAFEGAHPSGSRARLAFALLLYTGQRRSDVVTMGWQHMTGGRLSVVQQKTGKRLAIPIHPNLAAELQHVDRRSLAFLRTEAGPAFTAAGFGNWFRTVCDAAGLADRSAHGLRKAAARRLAEAGCSQLQIKSITGHATDAEVARYTAAASQVALADQAIARLTAETDPPDTKR